MFPYHDGLYSETLSQDGPILPSAASAMVFITATGQVTQGLS